MTNAKPGELMPCPFCGGSPSFIQHSKYYDGELQLSLGCCQFRNAGRREYLVKAWNTRASQSPPVQSDEVRKAVDAIRDLVKDDLIQPFVEDHLQVLIHAAEQRVAPQTIKSDNTEALYNALNRIKELEAEQRVAPRTGGPQEGVDRIKFLCDQAIKNGQEYIDDEEFNAYDCSGGNYDDACAIGKDIGAYHLAKAIIEALTAHSKGL